MKIASSRFLCVALALFLPALQAVALEEWEHHYPALPAHHLVAVATDDQALVVVSREGTIIRSLDGETWTPVHAGGGDALRAVAFASAQWVAGGDGGSLFSADGIAWQSVADLDGLHVRDLAWAGDRWSAVGVTSQGDGFAATSADGLSWEVEYEFAGMTVSSVAFSPGGLGVAVAREEAGGLGRVLRSTVPGLWEVVEPSLSDSFSKVRWDGSRFVAAGERGMVGFSDEGLDWEIVSVRATPELPDNFFPDAIFHDVISGPGFYLAIGERTYPGGQPTDFRAYSPDGVAWTTQTLSEASPPMHGLTLTPAGVIAVGEWNAVRRISSMSEWTLIAGGESAPFTGIAYGNGTYVAVGGMDSPLLRLPAWPPLVGNGVFPLRGLPRILTSADLEEWASQDPGTTNALYDVTFAEGYFTAVGRGGVILRSANGQDWQSVASPVTASLHRIIRADGHYVAVGEQAIIYSEDGLTWTAWPFGAGSGTFLDITWGNGKFVAVGASRSNQYAPFMLIAEHPGEWTEVRFPFYSYGMNVTTLRSVAYGRDGFYANGFVRLSQNPPSVRMLGMSSANGRAWQIEDAAEGPSMWTEYFQGAFYGSGYQLGIPYWQGEKLWRFTVPGEFEPASDETTPGYLLRLREVNGRLFGLGDGATIASAPASDQPFFERDPAGIVAAEGETVAFDFQAVDPLGDAYAIQWFRDGEPLVDGGSVSGSQGEVLEISNLTQADGGTYSVRLTNAAGERFSAGALLRVRLPVIVSLDYDASTPGFGVDRFASIQAAIDSADPDELVTVTVKPGIYHENIVFHGRKILLTSENPDDWAVVTSTVIDGGEAGSVVRFVNGEEEHSVLRGLTIRNGRARLGAGIYVHGSRPRIEKNWIVNNVAVPENETRAIGGGLYFNEFGSNLPNGTFYVMGNVIEGNVAEGTGGGALIALVGKTTTIIENNRFLGNVAEGNGGGLLVEDTSFDERQGVVARNNAFRENVAGNIGGGILVSGRALDILVERNVLTANQAAIGGGMYVSRTSSFFSGPFRTDVLDNYIADNTADTGGGFYLSGDSILFVQGNVITRNVAAIEGGGATVLPWGTLPAEFDRNTIVMNQAPVGAAFSTRQATIAVSNSIVAHNFGPSSYDPNKVAFSYSNLWKNGPFDDGLAEPPAGASGNISLDPLFADLEGGDFRLRSQTGRWAPAENGGAGGWVADAVHSPGIAAGAPDENGFRSNLGAYSLSAEASLPLDRPLVSVAVMHPGHADKATGEAAQLILSRTGPLEAELPLSMALTGSAELNVDLDLSGSLDFMAAGEAVKTVGLVPLPAETVRGDRAVEVTLAPAPAYHAGLADFAQVPVLDLPYHSWVAARYAPGSWNDPGLTGPFADPDGSGLVNLARFAFAADGGADRANLPQPRIHEMETGDTAPEAYLTLTYTRPVRHQGVEYAVEGSSNLVDWETATMIEVQIEPIKGGETERVTVREADPLSESGASRFLRMQLNLEEE